MLTQRDKNAAPKKERLWDVFVSHASEDKAAFVEPLAAAIEAAGYNVWYDRFTLKWGDSLRESIDRGLGYSRYGIVVLSKSFFAKKWPRAELDGLFARETNGQKVVLPIWHDVDAADVSHYSPILAGRLAMKSSDGMKAILSALRNVLGPPQQAPSATKIKAIEVTRVTDLEVLAKNVWWLAEQTPDRSELTRKLESILDQLRARPQAPAPHPATRPQPPQVTEKETTMQERVPSTPAFSLQRDPRFPAFSALKDPSRFEAFVALGRSGTAEAVNLLMTELEAEDSIATAKLVDYALGLASSASGRRSIEKYLFEGTQRQRNYAALYFKRRGGWKILEEACKAGVIDRVQAWAK